MKQLVLTEIPKWNFEYNIAEELWANNPTPCNVQQNGHQLYFSAETKVTDGTLHNGVCNLTGTI